MKKLILGLIFIGRLLAQTTGANVVELTPINNQTFTTGTYTLNTVPLQNRGQTSHTVKLQFSALSGIINYTGVLQGAGGNCINWFDIGAFQQSITVANNSTITLVGFGAFPCIRISGTLTVGGSASVILTENYTGSSAPVFNNIDQFASNTGLLNLGLVIGFTKTGFVAPPAGSNTAVVIYGLEITGDGSFTGITFQCGPTISTVDTTPLILMNSNTSGTKLLFPPGIRSLMYCPVGDLLYYTAEGSGTIAMYMQYRFE